MENTVKIRTIILCLFFGFSFIVSLGLNAREKFGFLDAMKFPEMRYQTISDDGKWVTYSLVPNRGDPKSFVISTKDTTHFELLRTTHPIFSKDSKWISFQVLPKAIDTANSEDEKPEQGLLLLNLETGERFEFDKVNFRKFSNDSRWLALHLRPESEKNKQGEKIKKEFKSTNFGSMLILFDLSNKNSLEINYVTEFSFDTLSNYLAFAISEPTQKNNGLYLLKLREQFEPPSKIDCDSSVIVSSIAWNNKKNTLTYIKSYRRKFSQVDSSLIIDYIISNHQKNLIITESMLDPSWFIPTKNRLHWTDDGNRLFFGIKPKKDTSLKKEIITFSDTNFYDIKTILNEANYTLWHWSDPRIKPNEKYWWGKNKDRVFLCLFNPDSKKFIQIADSNITDVEIVENSNYTIGYDENPYLLNSTWEGPGFKDLYLINLNTGEKKLIQKKITEPAQISPNGKYIVFYYKRNWHLFDPIKDTLVNLTGKMRYPFYNEDWDQPSEPPSYGFAGWFEKDAACLIYDKYDIWKFYTDSYSYICQTIVFGRDLKQTYRIVLLDEEKKFYRNFDTVFLSVFNHNLKTYSIYGLNFNILGPYQILEQDCNYKLIGKAKNSDMVLFSKEKFDLFPDLWVSETSFKNPRQITFHNKELVEKYEWGSTEIIRWVNSRGDSLEGFIIKPYNFNPDNKYPLIVYFYERFSQMANNFLSPYVGHRPCFQLYNSNDYIFFLPDIKYTIGSPGNSALDCIITGVKKLLSFGFIDSTSIGIMGHSWSGYQTAYIITQTNLFSAAVAGAAVGNMISAYSGIRLESGLARQFQYEKTQSRIGGNLWDSLMNYINNSPIFFAKQMRTPLLLMFGDEDQAVPWQQGIELYLALRRLQKSVFFLQYHNEPHWPMLFANRLDYAIKTKEFFDTYLKKIPPPDWIIKGENYFIKK